MLVGPTKALLMDEISTGLDSSTTYQIVNMLREYVQIMRGTAFISLLQPAPETYDLFDDIVLLSDGKIVYQGLRENVLHFFESMGFKCPDRKAVADFLQEVSKTKYYQIVYQYQYKYIYLFIVPIVTYMQVTSKKDQQQYWARKDEPYRFITVTEFATKFESHTLGRRLADELAVPYDKNKNHPAALTVQKYGLGKTQLLKACATREVLWLKKNSFIYFFRCFQASGTCIN